MEPYRYLREVIKDMETIKGKGKIKVFKCKPPISISEWDKNHLDSSLSRRNYIFISSDFPNKCLFLNPDSMGTEIFEYDLPDEVELEEVIFENK